MEPKRILVVDDETDLTHFLTLLINRRTGHQCEAAASAQQALRMLKESEFHLVVTDIHMPGMNGLELLREVKSSTPDIEVIMLTGQGALESAVGALQMQAYDYIEKPVNADRLVQAVKNALAQQALSSELTRTIAQVAALNRDLKRQVKEIERDRGPRERLAAAALIVEHIERHGPAELARLKTRIAARRPRPLAVDISEMIRGLSKEMSASYPAVEWTVDLPAEPIVSLADAGALAQAMRHLMHNAARAMAEKGVAVVGARVQDGAVEIGVRDRGPGFAEAALAASEDPLATGDGASTGLGLAIARAVAREHDGALTVATAPDGGAVVALRLALRG